MTKRTGVGRGNNPASRKNRPKASEQHRWKAGSRVCSTGHVKVRVGKGHPLGDPNGWAYEHTVVWVSAGNDRPKPGDVLHHVNGDKTDNRIENLQVMSRAAHNRLHNAEKGRCAKTGRLIGKKAAGRLLDGVEHNGFPEVRRG